MATERLRVILEMVTGQYKRGAQEAANATDGITKSGDAASKAVGGLTDQFGSFKKQAAAIGGAALVAFLKDASDSAIDLAESTNAVNKIFGDGADIVKQFGEVSASAVGLATSEFQQLAVNTGGLLRNFGFDAQSAASETIKLTTRASDLASVFNTDVSTALSAVNSALRGETEPIRNFNVNLDAAAIKAKAVELGLADTTSAVDDNARAVAALEIIYEQTSSAQGDFVQTSDDAANAQRRAAAQAENAKAKFGQSASGFRAFAFEFANAALLAGLALFGDEAAEQSFRFEEAIERIRRAFEDGTDPTIAFQEALAELTRNADLTAAQLQTLITFAGVDGLGFTMEELRDIVLENADVMSDLTDDELAEMEAAFNDLIGPTEGAGDAIGDLGDEAGSAAKETDRLKDSTVNLATELRKQADPVFRAVNAFQSYQDVLEQIDEDGERTAEELLDLAEAVLTSEEALSELGGGNLERGIQVIADAIDLTTEEVRDLLRELGILDGTNFTVTGTVIRATATAAESGTIDPSIAAAARRVGNRAFGGSVAAGQSYLVGERGPEFFTPNVSGRISSGPLGGATENVVINLNVTTEPGFSNQVVREMDQALSRYRSGVS